MRWISEGIGPAATSNVCSGEATDKPLAFSATGERSKTSIAAPGRTETFVSSFLEETGIAIHWDLGEAVWRSAGRAFQGYAECRRKQRDSGSRRILADSLIGAHAQTRSYRLLTLDERLYKAAFQTLTIETI